jgi:hypothetical protein
MEKRKMITISANEITIKQVKRLKENGLNLSAFIRKCIELKYENLERMKKEFENETRTIVKRTY